MEETDNERAGTAWHEAAHALLCIDTETLFTYATIKPDEDQGFAGRVTLEDAPEVYDLWNEPEKLHNQLLRLMVLMAGHEGMRLYLESPTASPTEHGADCGAGSDYHSARVYAEAMTYTSQEATALLDMVRHRAAFILKRDRKFLAAIANALLESETLSAEEVRRVYVLCAKENAP